MASNDYGFAYPEGFFSSYHSQKPICGVLAVALAAGVTYDVAAAALKQAMHDCDPKRQRFGGWTKPSWQNIALARLGVKFEETVIKSRKPKLIDAIKDFEPGVIYLVCTPKHIQTIKDGILIDQGKLAPVATCSQAKRHVNRIVKIIGKGW